MWRVMRDGVQIGEYREEEPELARVAWPHFSGCHERVGEAGLAREVAEGHP